MVFRISSAVLICLVAIAITGAMKESSIEYWNEGDHSKIIKFSHKFHIQEQGIDCLTCHQATETSQQSSDDLMPDHESCNTCHEEQISDECGYCHIDPENIVGIENPDRELIFSHEKHVGNNIECMQCHSGIEETDYASDKNMPLMGSCVSCHDNQAVAKECGICHADFVGLLPGDHLRGDFRKDHKRLTRLGDFDVTCSTCHSENFCQDCHTGMNLENFGVYRDLMSDPGTRVPQKDTPQQLKIQQAHSLNYRFTHGIDARSRDTDCDVCHERQTFCVECHQTGTLQENKIKPRNHREAGFITIGRGTGGGRHAQMAKRDIDYCASCHDLPGEDPVCMLCHTDEGGVR